MDNHAKAVPGTLPGSRSLAERRPFLTAFALSLGAAISLGLTRFSYALLLPPMRADLGWSYFLSVAWFDAPDAAFPAASSSRILFA